MKDKDYIKELFSEKLASHEVPVRSDLWAGIQSQLGNTAAQAAAAKGLSAAAKWAIGIASSVVVAGSVAWFALGDGSVQPAEQPMAQTAQPSAAPGQDAGQEELKAADESNVAIHSGTASARTLVKDGTVNAGTTSTVPGIDEISAPLEIAQAPAPPVNRQEQQSIAAGQPEKQAVAAPSRQADNQAVENAGNAVSKEVVGKVEKWVDVFTPNNDGANDFLQLKTANLKDFSITVMNSQNQVVFRSDNPDFKWDGTVNGEMVPEGNYIYMVVSTDTNGNQINKMVRLTITR